MPGTSRRRRADVLLRGARTWRVKLASITARDLDTSATVAAAGWLPVRVWEHEDPEVVADRVVALVRARR